MLQGKCNVCDESNVQVEKIPMQDNYKEAFEGDKDLKKRIIMLGEL